MFNLESSLSAWHSQMLVTRLSPDALDELESHLRDDIAQQLRSGLDQERAFEAAVQRLGHPATLQKEFKKNRSLIYFAIGAKNALLSFAGIPNHQLYMNEPSLKLDSRWNTYLRSAAFLAPALGCWILGVIYVIPQFNSVWQATMAKLGDHSGSGFEIDKTLRTVIAILYLCRDNLVYVAAFAVLILALLEWRSRRWPRYRRAVIGAGVFLINLTVLLSFGIMFIAATIAAGNLLSHAKP